MEKLKEEQGGHLLSFNHMMTFSGLSSATYVVTNALKVALGLDPRTTGFVVAVSCCLFMVRRFHRTDVAIAFINGCAVYLCTAGGSSVVGAVGDMAPTHSAPQAVSVPAHNEPVFPTTSPFDGTLPPVLPPGHRTQKPRPTPKPTPTVAVPAPQATPGQAEAQAPQNTKEFLSPWFVTQ